jgi:hypothetical protein
MFYTIYQTTNLINGKMYIGKHQTEDLNDKYLGSGLMLLNAIKKYGDENFIKEILFIFDNEEEMNLKEAELITSDVVLSDDYYNIAMGGYGGAIVLKKDNPLYESTCKKISDSAKSRSLEMSKIVKELHKDKKVGMYGKKQSDNQKISVSEALKGKKQSEEHVRNHRESMMKTFNDPNYVHPNTGKIKTPEQIEKMKEISKNRPKKTCPHCDIQMDERNYARYHGHKCKMNQKLQYEDTIQN